MDDEPTIVFISASTDRSREHATRERTENHLPSGVSRLKSTSATLDPVASVSVASSARNGRNDDQRGVASGGIRWKPSFLAERTVQRQLSLRLPAAALSRRSARTALPALIAASVSNRRPDLSPSL